MMNMLVTLQKMMSAIQTMFSFFGSQLGTLNTTPRLDPSTWSPAPTSASAIAASAPSQSMKEQELQLVALTAELEARRASLRSIGQSAIAFGKTEARVAAEKRVCCFPSLVPCLIANLSALGFVDWIRDNVPYVNDWSNPLESGSTLPLLDFGVCSSPDNSLITSIRRWRTGVIRPAFSQSQKADDDEAYNSFTADDRDVGDSDAWPSNPNDRFKEDRMAEKMRMRNEKVAQRNAELNSHGDEEDDDATAAPLSKRAKGLQVGSKKKKRKTGGTAQVLLGVSATSARDDDEASEKDLPSTGLSDSNAERRRVQIILAGK
ncbi:BQ5605_C001g00111 [Microbotryum silenes-dioicae]|uniref:BQ5605_C001g00111 protein n=1 Tax=Microbotryum silenes-dioicae TaxID=796604 RepID=A0A2X0NZE4_9BASI|nr:BQ5605_C001g00111 [Microbotryum silenes-dioicae]